MIKSRRRAATGVLFGASVGAVLMFVSGAFASSSSMTMNGGDSLSVTCSGPSLSWAQVNSTGGTLTCKPAPTASGVLLGNTVVQATSDASSAPASEAFGFTASSSGIATSISAYLTSVDGVNLALYSDNSGRPGTRLISGQVTKNKAGWTTLSLSGAVNISAGSRYWIAIGGVSGGSVTYRDSTGGTNLDYSGAGFASPYATNGQWNSNPLSAYVSGTTAQSTPIVTTATTLAPTTTTIAPTTTTTVAPTTSTTVAPTTTTTVAPPPSGPACVVSGPTTQLCPNSGAWSDPNIAWSNGSNIYNGPDAWACGSNNCGPTSGTTFTASSAENFSITTNQPAGNGGVLMFPSAVVYPPDPVLSTLHSLTSGYSETMPINSGTTGWGAYDIFMNSGQEVMIQTEQEHACIPCSATLGTATISGIPMTVLQYGGSGGEIIFVPTTTATGTSSGTMDLLGAFNWLIAHGYLSSSDSLGLISFGHEICSTGGVPETWTVSKFTVSES